MKKHKSDAYDRAYAAGYRDGQRDSDGGGLPWLWLLGAGAAAYYILNNPQAREAVTSKAREYGNAAKEGKLPDVVKRDVQNVQGSVKDLQEAASNATESAKKAAEIGKVAVKNSEPAAKLAGDAAEVLASDDPQKVGEAVQDAKAQLGNLGQAGKEAAKVVAEDKDGKPGSKR